ncbi:DUF1289 domain-containing protein [Vibrio kasasachensis]|uniref:DUF1289 domain-containing protein n=1 Tax=Vibrio kasasachensis TaxID=2910248 RepID=UPI003D0DF386
MEQLEIFAVASPCVGVCNADEKGYCMGCMRKRTERFNWLSMTPAEQLYVLKLCRQRYRRKMQVISTVESSTQPESNSPQQTLFEE